jgi:nitroreductase
MEASLARKVEPGIMEAICNRRSIRRYLPVPVEKSAVRELLSAAVHAPTAMHEEPWAFTVIQDRVLLDKLSSRAKPLFAEEMRRRAGGAHSFGHFLDPAFDLFHGAGTLIVIGSSLSGPFVVADVWLAAGNLMLAAYALGLGTCVIGSAVAAINTPEAKRELGIPEAYTAIAPIIVGVPDEAPASVRKEPLVLAYK